MLQLSWKQDGTSDIKLQVPVDFLQCLGHNFWKETEISEANLSKAAVDGYKALPARGKRRRFDFRVNRPPKIKFESWICRIETPLRISLDLSN